MEKSTDLKLDSNENATYHDLCGAVPAGRGRKFMPSRDHVPQGESVKINDGNVLLEKLEKEQDKSQESRRKNNLTDCVDVSGPQVLGVVMPTPQEAPAVGRCGVSGPRH